jgi:hypothetical protein
LGAKLRARAQCLVDRRPALLLPRGDGRVGAALGGGGLALELVERRDPVRIERAAVDRLRYGAAGLAGVAAVAEAARAGGVEDVVEARGHAAAILGEPSVGRPGPSAIGRPRSRAAAARPVVS